MSQGTRIRYKKAVDGKMVSPEYLGGQDLYMGVVDTTTRTVSLQVKKDGVYGVVKLVNFDTLPFAKKFVKDALKEVGVTFYEEARMKKVKGVV